MKKRIVVLLFAACLLLAACQAEDPENRLETTPEETGSTEKEMPDVMKELAQNEAVEWMAGLWVEIPSGELQERTQGVEAYACESSGIQATVTLQNGLEKIQPYYLMVFADGLPVEFQMEGDTYQRYPLELPPQQTVLSLAMQPEFTLSMGRLDFLLFFDGNPISDQHMVSYTVWITQEEGERQPENWQSTVPQREGLVDSFTNGAYGAWVWSAEPAESDHTGPKELTVSQGEEILLEAIASGPGRYRTVLVFNGQPLTFTLDGEACAWLDWESAGTDMLQVPVQLPENWGEEGSFFTVTTPLGTESIPQPTMVSWKIRVTSVPNGEE